MNTSFESVEQYDNNQKDVYVSFDTRQHGIFQICCEYDDARVTTTELINEPDLMMFTSAERKYIKRVCAIVWRMVYDSKKPDFDEHKDG